MKIKGELSIVFAYFLISTFGIFARFLSKEIHPVTQVAIRFSIASTIFFVLFFRDKNTFRVSKKEFLILAVAGFIGYGIMVVLYVYSFLNASYANAAAFNSLNPVYLVILGWFFLREKIDSNTFLALVVAVAGMVFVFRPDFSNFEIGMAYAAACSFLNSVFFIVIRFLRDVNYKARTLITLSFAGFGLLPFAFIIENGFSFSAVSWIVLIIMAVLNVMSFGSLQYGLKYVEAGKAGILTSCLIIFGTIISVVVYNEALDVFEIIGTLLIILSIALINIKAIKPLKLGVKNVSN